MRACCRVAQKLLKSKTGERTTAPPGSYRRASYIGAAGPHHLIALGREATRYLPLAKAWVIRI